MRFALSSSKDGLALYSKRFTKVSSRVARAAALPLSFKRRAFISYDCVDGLLAHYPWACDKPNKLEQQGVVAVCRSLVGLRGNCQREVLPKSSFGPGCLRLDTGSILSGGICIKRFVPITGNWLLKSFLGTQLWALFSLSVPLSLCANIHLSLESSTLSHCGCTNSGTGFVQTFFMYLPCAGRDSLVHLFTLQQESQL